ncbi:transcription factor 23 [Danaus plexippus]|uniref:Basic helix-loop-helix type transcription factor HLH54F n=1 Tax=Danaus plexippus plexippus TaxID=278856 RepID=A0A212EUE9_DANPL|nr:transcription factor 23 [Danaus plexippus]OWR45087.1 basic helix-loop-helix type transcription factor HLH54F [Danaus plexippus plexippus]
MPRKRLNRSNIDKRVEDGDDDAFLFEDSLSSSGRSGHEPQHRNAANARERARMRVLSKAFCRLKTTLPWVPADTKLSKLDTLRLAASYIAHLRALLHEPRSAHTPPHPLNLAWPFAFQHGGSLSCTISQRWSVNTQNCDSTAEERNQIQREIHNSGRCNENYNQDYSENDYEDRNYEEMTNDVPCNNVQYCDYGYKENYYEMRNSYSSNGLMNV